MRGRALTLAVGAGSMLAGVTVLVLGTPPWLPTLAGRPGLLAFALVALLAAGLAARDTADRATDSPDVGALPSVGAGNGRVAGERFDRQLAGISSVSDPDEREAVRERLETAAVHTLAVADGTDPGTVRQRLAEGTWTDDRQAAAFFAHEGTERSVRERVRAVVGGTPVFQQRARRAVAVLHERTDDPDRGQLSQSGGPGSEATATGEEAGTGTRRSQREGREVSG